MKVLVKTFDFFAKKIECHSPFTVTVIQKMVWIVVMVNVSETANIYTPIYKYQKEKKKKKPGNYYLII